MTAGRLRGTFNAVADTEYTLTFMIPESYSTQEVVIEGLGFETRLKDNSLRVRFEVKQDAPLYWQVTFRNE